MILLDITLNTKMCTKYTTEGKDEPFHDFRVRSSTVGKEITSSYGSGLATWMKYFGDIDYDEHTSDASMKK